METAVTCMPFDWLTRLCIETQMFEIFNSDATVFALPPPPPLPAHIPTMQCNNIG